MGSLKQASVLLVGTGGIGTIAALNLEKGGLAAVTAVLRSNFDAVEKNGFNIESVDHGSVKAFRPSKILRSVPDVSQDARTSFDYIVCTTKNVPDISPTLIDVIRPAVTPGHSVIVLVQNGLNIEKPLLKAFPDNIILSGTSMCGSHEYGHGIIIHDDSDKLLVGPFRNQNRSSVDEDTAAKEFCRIYSAAGKTQTSFDDKVPFTRWRKLLYNGTLNPICALTDLDTGRLRLAPGVVETLVRPAMQEIRAAARAAGQELPEELVEFMINVDPITMYNPPSMCVDVRKGRYIEFENILGEPLREGEKLGVAMPTIRFLYNFCKAIQWRTMERNGVVKIPGKEDFSTVKV